MASTKLFFLQIFWHVFLIFCVFFHLREIYIRRPWKLSNFQDPPFLFIYVQNFFTPLTMDIQFPPPPPPPPIQMIANQLKENIIQGWLLYVIRLFLQVSFRFQYQLINVVQLSFDFFSFGWNLTICFFRGSMLLWVQFFINIKKYLLFTFIYYSHFWCSFCN